MSKQPAQPSFLGFLIVLAPMAGCARNPLASAPRTIEPARPADSRTVSDAVIGYDLSTGIPVEKVRYPTVQQPNTLALDETSDTLCVVSGSGAG